jgi:hypothetical protein
MSITALQENLAIARSSGTYLRYRAKLAKFDLIILDEMGMQKFTATEAQDLCEISEERSIDRSVDQGVLRNRSNRRPETHGHPDSGHSVTIKLCASPMRGAARSTQKHVCGFAQLWVDVGSPATATAGPSLSGYNEKPG